MRRWWLIGAVVFLGWCLWLWRAASVQSEHPTGKLVVKVVDANGAPLYAYPVAMGPGEEIVQFARREGQYEATKLSRGTWNVQVVSDGPEVFRGQQVTVGEAPVEIVMREATDGATIEVKIVGEAVVAKLLSGALRSPDELDGAALSTALRIDRSGIVHHVLPGPHTVVLDRPEEVSLETIEVKEGGNAVWTITPRWQPRSQKFHWHREQWDPE